MSTQQVGDPLKQPDQPIISVGFDDGSLFALPKEWEDVFVDYFGPNPERYPEVIDSLRFVISKYVEHRAWPSKFDGLQWMAEDKPIPNSAFDDPEFYWEHWDEWEEEGREWGAGEARGRIPNPPTCAQVAEAVMYQQMRGGLLQKALQQLGAPTRVVSAKQFLGELEDRTDP